MIDDRDICQQTRTPRSTQRKLVRALYGGRAYRFCALRQMQIGHQMPDKVPEVLTGQGSYLPAQNCGGIA
jgi:hypothetical protein